MSTIHTVRFFIYKGLRGFSHQEIQRLVNIAYQTARDRKLFPMEVLIRSGVHNTTKIKGVYQKDPGGPHVTLCYKTENHMQRGTHVASHGYVKSMKDWAFTGATHDYEKADDTKKGNGEEVWPALEFMRELPTIEYGITAEYMDEWRQSSESVAAMDYNQTLDFSLATTSSAGESSQAGGQQAGEALSVDVETDAYAEVEAKESHYLTIKLLDGSIFRTEAAGWKKAYAWYGETWVECCLYVSQRSGTRYWTWSLEPDKPRHDKSNHKKSKGRK